MTQRSFLHVGCGQKHKNQTTRGFNSPNWKEIRFDIDKSVKPDIVGTMLDMSAVETESVDAIYSSHNIEHLYAYQVPIALAEFRRVLKPEGFLVITCPDVQAVCALVAQDKLSDKAYDSPAGPITPIDILWGLRSALELGNHYMAHKVGFTQKVLQGTLQAAGFVSVATSSRPPPFFELWSVSSKSDLTEEAIRLLAQDHFPHKL